MLTIYSKPNCGFCHRAKRFLDQHHVKYEEVDVAHDEEAMNFFRKQGHRTVPQIYNGDILIGGYNDLMKKKEMVL